jgi:hypothetical protein
MSVSSVTDLAVNRDMTPPDDDLGLNGERATWGRTLVRAIPTEILAVYTAGLGIAVGLVTPGEPQAYLPFRFAWYGVWLIVTPVLTAMIYLRKTNVARRAVYDATRQAHPHARPPRRVSWWRAFFRWEVAATFVAAGAWFTAMPGSPWEVQLTGSAFAITSMAATAVGVLLFGLLTQPLTMPTSENPRAVTEWPTAKEEQV